MNDKAAVYDCVNSAVLWSRQSSHLYRCCCQRRSMRWCAGDARPPEGLHWTRRPGVRALQAFQHRGWTDPAWHPARMSFPVAVYNQMLEATFCSLYTCIGRRGPRIHPRQPRLCLAQLFSSSCARHAHPGAAQIGHNHVWCAIGERSPTRP